MIPKRGNRFSEEITLRLEHDREKWRPVFGKDHAPEKYQGLAVIRLKAIAL
jgi:hypothetical protein